MTPDVRPPNIWAATAVTLALISAVVFVGRRIIWLFANGLSWTAVIVLTLWGAAIGVLVRGAE